jgi:crotonobetainyl-CoA:carnitine CoA-transferase CaiB-like acyl-CoA transferase
LHSDNGEPGPAPATDVRVEGDPGHLPSRFQVEDLAVASVGTALLAAAALAARRGGDVPSLLIDRGHVAAAVRSERYFRRSGRPAGPGFAPLSRFWRTADGWIRTHANYPWHRRALVAALQAGDDPAALEAAMLSAPGRVLEERIVSAGGVAGAVRAGHEWRAHPQGMAVAAEPLIGHVRLGDAGPRSRPAGTLPASGVRVVDLTRVIAGPVCTRFLGALGADVLRIDPPRLPDMAQGDRADTLLAKRSSALDLGDDDQLLVLHRLVHDADVVVCGYRPGGLEKFGMGPEDLAARHGGLVVVYLAAWGHGGPWAGRRGFDSVVQAPTGLSLGESTDGDTPGALPCQLLDHATGYLAAAAALDGLRRQAMEGGAHIRRVSLARTAAWVLSAPSPPSSPVAAEDDGYPARWLQRIDTADGPVEAVAPPGSLAGEPLRWPGPPAAYQEDPPAWQAGGSDHASPNQVSPNQASPNQVSME